MWVLWFYFLSFRFMKNTKAINALHFRLWSKDHHSFLPLSAIAQRKERLYLLCTSFQTSWMAYFASLKNIFVLMLAQFGLLCLLTVLDFRIMIQWEAWLREFCPVHRTQVGTSVLKAASEAWQEQTRANLGGESSSEGPWALVVGELVQLEWKTASHVDRVSIWTYV